MFKVRLSLLILVLMSPLTQAATDCAAVTEIPSTECEVLIALYNSTNGDSWKNHNGWNETNTPCSWYGVTCNGGHVSEIRLYNNELGGTIPTELGNLSDLTLLDLSTSWISPVKLTGTIPTELGNLSNLMWLALYNNELTGTIPTELGNLSNLTSLSLGSNDLTGTIPTELGNLSNLTSLSLGSNELTGTIPTELGNLSNLTRLYLDNNELTGTIPTELGNLSNLTYLYLYDNQLTGTIPTELGNLSNLTRLYLDNNELTGTIPTELGNLSNLKRLFLYSNQLCGEIPIELKNLSKIELPNDCYHKSCLDIDNNYLTATDSELIEWLDTYNPGWQTTQTPCPQLLQFTSATYNVNENEGQATITVTRTGSSDGAVSIDYAASDDTATAPDDYIQSTGTLNWNDGDIGDKIFTIPIINDAIVENDESFNLTLSNATGGATIGEPAEAIVTITDDDSSQPGTLQFSKAEYSIAENGGSVTLTVKRINGNDGIVFLAYTSTDGSATAEEDYSPVFNTLTWTDGDASDKTFTVPILDDTIFEGNETFSLTLTNATGGATIGEPAEAIVTINDNDTHGTLQFSKAEYSIVENGGSITLVVKRINGNDGNVSVKYTTKNDTAMAGEDYTKTKGELKWTDGDASDKTFTVPIFDDTIFEGNETFNLTLSEATGGATIGEPAEAVVTIIDNDIHGTLQFSEATYNVDENGGNVTLKVNRIDNSDGAISIDYATSDDTATASNDYTAKIGTLNWENGDSTDKTITINITDDSTPENEETFIVSLANPTGGAQLGKPDTAKVTITDNDQTEKHGTLQFSKDQFTVKENVHTAEVIITVKRIEGSDGAVLVEYAASDDSAKAGSDYTYTKGGLRWEDGDDDDKTFIVPIINDDEPENDETFIVSLANPIGGAQIGSPDTAIVTIKDDDKPFNCKKVSDISKKECQALIALYDSTDGENWVDNTGWKTTNSPCSWDGITCRSKHVTGLSLGDNNLKGSISKKLSKLKQLKILLLNNNKLSGKIPSSLMKLKKLEELDLNDNCLKTKVSKKLKKWLDELNPGWDETQTDCQ
jgi:Leucine-rich repeat (LRR) protein/ribosomal protein L35AE/L33A